MQDAVHIDYEFLNE